MQLQKIHLKLFNMSNIIFLVATILFAPEMMNAEAGYHSPIIFSPDMTEAF